MGERQTRVKVRDIELATRAADTRDGCARGAALSLGPRPDGQRRAGGRRPDLRLVAGLRAHTARPLRRALARRLRSRSRPRPPALAGAGARHARTRRCARGANCAARRRVDGLRDRAARGGAGARTRVGSRARGAAHRVADAAAASALLPDCRDRRELGRPRAVPAARVAATPRLRESRRRAAERSRRSSSRTPTHARWRRRCAAPPTPTCPIAPRCANCACRR